jgi:DNA-binding IscR family transcriptional regulator
LLNRPSHQITLLAIVEACQGAIVGSYCEDIDDLGTTCAFHRAAVELRNTIISALSHWNLEQLAKSPGPTKRLPGGKQCMMTAFPLAIAGPILSGKGQKKNALD